MNKSYLTQAWYMLKENKLLSIISVIATAAAIAMIMVILILANAKISDYEPEVYRSRSLYVKSGSAVKKDDEAHRNYGRLSLYDVRQVFYPLATAEAVSAILPYGNVLLSLPASQEEENVSLLYTDAAFWEVNRFSVLAGKPYGQVSFEAGQKQVVVNESIARRLFGSVEEAVGKEVYVNFVAFTVCSVVKDVSKFAELSYAEVWLPYTANSELSKIDLSGWGEGHSGSYMCIILARSAADFPKIREEIKQNLDKMNANSREFRLDIMRQPYTFFEQMINYFSNSTVDSWTIILKYAAIIFIILLVPAINLSGITLSRMRKRLSELGIRRAFGASRAEILTQVLAENLLTTFIGGIAGLALSYLALWGLSGWLLASANIDEGVAAMNTSMISLPVFLTALAFCLLLNLLSAGVPAWKVSRAHVVEAINERD